VNQFKFRCVKITFEEKKSVRLIKGDEQHLAETTVAVQFEQAGEPSQSMHGYGYASLNLSDEQFKEYGYRVGQEYVLGRIVHE
jgi:hypothetical protein